MAKRGFLGRHRVKRTEIKKDLLYFFFPWISVFFIGLVLASQGRYAGFWTTIGDLIRHPGNLFTLPLPKAAGLGLFALGLSIVLTAHFTIGRFYSSMLVIKEDHQLIIHGIYRFTRNPIYLGTLMGSIGLPVFAASLSGALVMLILIPIFLYRISMEEKLLIEEFGDAYRAYMKQTRRLIPFIY